MTFTTNLSQLLTPGLNEILFQELANHQEEYSQFCKVETSDRAYEQDQEYTGFGLAVRKPQGAPITFDDPKEAGSKRYIPDVFALAWQVTEEMMDDDQYGLIRQMPGLLSEGLMEGVEQNGANILNLGFSTTTINDGLSLFNTAHPLQDGAGTTISNALNPVASFSRTALQNILLLFENMVDNRNLKKRLEPTNLWVPPALQFEVSVILQSQFEPETGNNAINPVQGRLKPTVLHRLTSDTRWFVSAASHNKVKFIWRKRPVMDSNDDFKTKSAQFSIHARYATGATTHRGWAASDAV